MFASTIVSAADDTMTRAFVRVRKDGRLPLPSLLGRVAPSNTRALTPSPQQQGRAVSFRMSTPLPLPPLWQQEGWEGPAAATAARDCCALKGESSSAGATATKVRGSIQDKGPTVVACDMTRAFDFTSISDASSTWTSALAGVIKDGRVIFLLP